MPSADPAAASLPGRWFDGRSSRAQPVHVRLVRGDAGPALQLAAADTPDAVLFERPYESVGWPERFRPHALPSVVTVDLREQGSLEMPDPQAWLAAMAAAGARPSLAERMQTQWRVLAAVGVVALAVLWGFYRWGTPWAATQVAKHVPLGWELALAQRALEDLDRNWLQPSALPPARQAELRSHFDDLLRAGKRQPARFADYEPALRLEFRKGFGANAFALPGGTVVITDGMVELAARHGMPDDALTGVLAHEIGHVLHRHTTRALVQHGIVNVAMGLALGDTSWVFANATTLLTALHYSRRHENEADCHALALMAAAGRPTRPMGALLLRVANERPEALDGPRRGNSGWADLLSTHPDTVQRARELAEGASSACEPK
jgi:Zn-dependent protease with chaperone function